MDPLSFPVLAGAALSQAFGFLFGRLAHLLDSRGQKSVEEEAIETPPVLTGQLKPLIPRPEAVEEHLSEIQELVGKLFIYDRSPERLDGQDDTLREDLARARVLLEQIYGQRFTFAGEKRPPTGVYVEQKLDTVSGRAVGVRGGKVRQAQVRQEAREVRKGSSIVGVDADEVG